jgi:hypothetical protein
VEVIEVMKHLLQGSSVHAVGAGCGPGDEALEGFSCGLGGAKQTPIRATAI